jgi:hypothetical protein
VIFGALLEDERAGDDPEVQVVVIQKIATVLGHKEPERGTVQPYRDKWLAAYERWRRKEDAGV